MNADTEELPHTTATAIDANTQKEIEQDNEVYHDQSSTDPYVYGYIVTPDTQNVPQQKDNQVTQALRDAFQQVNTNTTIDFPYVSEIPVDEYDATIKIFCKAFPWLYPGGQGDINDISDVEEDLDSWMERLLYYYDGRFAKDKMWCFFALNYAARRRNATSGSYFVNDFYKHGPKHWPIYKLNCTGGNWIG